MVTTTSKLSQNEREFITSSDKLNQERKLELSFANESKKFNAYNYNLTILEYIFKLSTGAEIDFQSKFKEKEQQILKDIVGLAAKCPDQFAKSRIIFTVENRLNSMVCGEFNDIAKKNAVIKNIGEILVNYNAGGDPAMKQR